MSLALLLLYLMLNMFRMLTFWRRNYFFFLADPVYKM